MLNKKRDKDIKEPRSWEQFRQMARALIAYYEKHSKYPENMPLNEDEKKDLIKGLRVVDKT